VHYFLQIFSIPFILNVNEVSPAVDGVAGALKASKALITAYELPARRMAFYTRLMSDMRQMALKIEEAVI
jgi:hypothetical protein